MTMTDVSAEIECIVLEDSTITEKRARIVATLQRVGMAHPSPDLVESMITFHAGGDVRFVDTIDGYVPTEP